jgi:hypothetical protein
MKNDYFLKQQEHSNLCNKVTLCFLWGISLNYKYYLYEFKVLKNIYTNMFRFAENGYFYNSPRLPFLPYVPPA